MEDFTKNIQHFSPSSLTHNILFFNGYGPIMAIF